MRLINYWELGSYGANWYTDTIEPLRYWASRLNCPFERLCDLLSIFSPRVQVSRSVKLVANYLHDNRLDTVMLGVRQALSHYEKTGVIRGLKTGAFARCLKGCQKSIVLDVWMAKALGVNQYVFSTLKGYRENCRRILGLSNYLGVNPSSVQAGIWTGVILTENRTPTSLVDSLGYLESGGHYAKNNS